VRRIACILALLLAATPALADRRHRDAPASSIDRREKVKQKIRALRAYTLTDELQLDERTAARLFPVLAKWDDVTDKLLAQRGDIARQLAVPDGKDPRMLDRLIDDSVANQKAMWDLEDKRIAELRKILTPAQTAKLLVVLPRFERRIRNQLQRVIEGTQRRGRARDDIDDTDDADDEPRQLPAQAPPTRGAPRAPDAGAPCDVFSSRTPCPPATRR
jgi:hypothetical protein